jgi:arylsulfatase A-like enzyme
VGRAAGLVLACALALACAPEGGPERANVVLLLADDLGWGDLGATGAPDLRTPELDSLARDGALFTDAYAASPVCSPTRAALLTGLYPQRLGHRFEDFLRSGSQGLDPARVVGLAERLRRAGYRTACYGKWNLENRRSRRRWTPNAHGFEHWFGAFYNHDRLSHRGNTSGEPDLFEDGRPVVREGYTDLLLADHAVAFIERTAGEPFFLYVPWLLVHYPLQVPDGRAPPLDPRATYARMVELLDLQVGRILAALRAAGVEGETLVVFTSDNGGHQAARNAPWSGHKGSLAEGGIRVPLLLRWPGRIPPGRRIATPVVTMDLTATILAAAGLSDEIRGLDGIDLLPWLAGAAARPERALFWRKRRFLPKQGIDLVEARATRQGEWKLLLEGESERLFRLADDPGERRDLAAREPERLARLRERLAEWEREVEPATP